MTWILCIVFFLSGASALVFETLWFHQAGLAFGQSVWASSLVLAGFMAGMGVGNGLAAWVGDRVRAPVRAYAALEVTIAVAGVALVHGLPHLGPVVAALLGPWAEAPLVLGALRLAAAFALLLVPSMAMGATLPLLTRALAARDPSFGRVLGRLYGWNTLGAVAGVLAAEAWLVEALGIRGTAWAAGLANLAAAAVAFALAWRALPALPEAAAAPAAGAVASARGLRLLAATFLAGFALLALEVVWFRFLSLFVMEYSLSFALMLGCVLTGIALGGFAGGAWLRIAPGAHALATPVACAAGALCIASYAASPAYLSPSGARLATDPLGILRMGAPLMLPVSLLSGVLFTLLGAGLRGSARGDAGATGALTFANTAGAALGALAGGFALLPLLGMERSLFVLPFCYAGVALLALAPGRRPRAAAAAGLAVLAASGLAFPFGAMADRHLQSTIERWLWSGTGEVALVREGLTGTVVYLDRRAYGGRHLSYRLITNGYSMSATSNKARRYMQLYVYWPVALHPAPRDALLISYGVGSTARALVQTRELRHVDVVDISETILEASHVVHPDPARHPLRDPRVEVHVEDGRYFLETTQRRYDLITSEPPPPRMAGVVNLYTREYFAKMRERLREGGVVTYWLPIHSLSEVSSRAVLRAFCDVFEDCSLWHGSGYDLMMVGTRGLAGPVPAERFAQQWRDPEVGAEMRELGFERPEQLGALFIGDAAYLDALTRGTPPIVDDWPRRILAPSAHGDRTPPEYRAFMDAAAARERFRTSAWVAALWPEELREATLPYFEVQALLDETAMAGFQDLDGGIEALDGLLRGGELATPVLWLLNTEGDVQRAAAEVTGPEREHPSVQLQLGIGALARRDLAAAAEHFARSEGHPHRESRRQAFRLHAYALCLLDRCDEAERLARSRYAQVGGSGPLPPFWSWMETRFGLTLPARVAQAASLRE